MDQPTRILRLHVENFKCIQVIDISPTADVIEIAGPNQSGKSSCLDSIQALIEGVKALPDEPIRHGQTSARLSATLGTRDGTKKYLVERTLSADKKPTLAIKKSSGAKFSSSQSFLDDLASHLAFDPQSFLLMKPKDQFEALRQIAGVDPAALKAFDDQIAEAYSERTEANRRAKDAQAAAESIAVPDGLPDKREDVAKLLDELTRINAENAAKEKEQDRRDRLELKLKGFSEERGRRHEEIVEGVTKEERLRDRDVADYERQIRDLQARIEAAKKQADTNIAAIKKMKQDRINELVALDSELRAEIDALPPIDDPVSVGDVQDRMAGADEINRGIAQRERQGELVALAEKAKAESEALTKKIDEATAAKQAAIASAKLPVEGIGFGDGVILLNGIPFEQCSTGQKWETACAVAMSGNPEIRVLLVHEGSLLDKKKRAVLEKMAGERGFQIWIESVADSDVDGAIMMREGKEVSSLRD